MSSAAQGSKITRDVMLCEASPGSWSPRAGPELGEAVAEGLPPEAAVQCACGARLTLRAGKGQLRTASGLGRAARMHTAGAGSLLSLVYVVEQGGRRWTGLAAAVRGRSVPCLHVGGVLASSGPFVGKWQPWEGGLLRLYGLGEVGGGRACARSRPVGSAFHLMLLQTPVLEKPSSTLGEPDTQAYCAGGSEGLTRQALSPAQRGYRVSVTRTGMVKRVCGFAGAGRWQGAGPG